MLEHITCHASVTYRSEEKLHAIPSREYCIDVILTVPCIWVTGRGDKLEGNSHWAVHTDEES